MNLIVATLFVIAIVLLLIALAYLAREMDDAAERKRLAVLSEHDHEMISGRVP